MLKKCLKEVLDNDIFDHEGYDENGLDEEGNPRYNFDQIEDAGSERTSSKPFDFLKNIIKHK